MNGLYVEALARTILNDPDKDHWSPEDVLAWINAGERDIVTHRPKALTVTQNITITAGASRQSYPADVLQVLDLMCNMGADGAAPGAAISCVSADRMNAADRDWRRRTGVAVRHLVIDDRDKDAFYVWPVQVVATQVEALVCKRPVELTSLEQTLNLSSDYANALAEYVLHMAFAKDSENGNEGLSSGHYMKYAATIGIAVKQQKRASAPANAATAPDYPAVDKNGQ